MACWKSYESKEAVMSFCFFINTLRHQDPRIPEHLQCKRKKKKRFRDMLSSVSLQLSTVSTSCYSILIALECQLAGCDCYQLHCSICCQLSSVQGLLCDMWHNSLVRVWVLRRKDVIYVTMMTKNITRVIIFIYIYLYLYLTVTDC